jgi:hypothetical protein
MESELLENIAKDVMEKLNRVYVGDLDYKIDKLEQLAKLQYQFFQSTISVQDLNKYKATASRITELKMERNLRLLRLSPEMLSHLGN